MSSEGTLLQSVNVGCGVLSGWFLLCVMLVSVRERLRVLVCGPTIDKTERGEEWCSKLSFGHWRRAVHHTMYQDTIAEPLTNTVWKVSMFTVAQAKQWKHAHTVCPLTFRSYSMLFLQVCTRGLWTDFLTVFVRDILCVVGSLVLCVPLIASKPFWCLF